MRVKIAILFMVLLGFFAGFSSDTEQSFYLLRKKMVEEQINSRGITDKRILNAFMKVRRHLFIKPELRRMAYDDYLLDIGEGQAISQPYIVAVMTYAAAPETNKKVLEIGTGSGYHSAILAELVHSVYTIELIGSLAQKAKHLLDGMGYKNIKFKIGDGHEGWAKYAPYDSIIVTCNEDHIPPALIDQLRVGGRMIIPVSYSSNVQELIVLEKRNNKGDLKKTNLIPVQLMPMIKGNKRK
ncbi:MAG: protein-L-isoaspartate(D-aspartate) O-methyltransferase [Candidatus Omnitrophota bacterium]